MCGILQPPDAEGSRDAERARKLSQRIESCYTPEHGSWLNMAEIEISVLVRQCLGGRRIPEVGGDLAAESASLVRGTQPAGSERGLALHDRRCPNEAAQALSIHRALTED